MCFLNEARKMYWRMVDNIMSQQMEKAIVRMGKDFCPGVEVESYDKEQTMSLIADFVGPNCTHYHAFAAAIFEKAKTQTGHFRGQVVTVNCTRYWIRWSRDDYGPVETRKQLFGFHWRCHKSTNMPDFSAVLSDDVTNAINLEGMVNNLVNVLLENRICPGCNKLSPTEMCAECTSIINTTPCSFCGNSFGKTKDGMHTHCKRAAKRRRIE